MENGCAQLDSLLLVIRSIFSIFLQTIQASLWMTLTRYHLTEKVRFSIRQLANLQTFIIKPEQQADRIYIFHRSAEAGVDVLRTLLSIPADPSSLVGVGRATILHTTLGFVPLELSRYESRVTLCLTNQKIDSKVHKVGITTIYQLQKDRYYSRPLVKVRELDCVV